VSNRLSINLMKGARQKFSFLFLCIVFCASTIAQENDEVLIRHYQQKLELGDFILKNDSFLSNVYPIPLPDSIYSGGNITVKKLKVGDSKFEVLLTFKNKKYTSITYIPKNNKSKKILLDFLKNISKYEEKKINSRKIAYIIR